VSGIQEIFEKAVGLTVLNHTLLQVAITDEETKRPLWVRLDSINLKDQIEWQPVRDDVNFEEALRETTERQHDTHYINTETRPSWYVTVQDFRFMFQYKIHPLFTHPFTVGVPFS
jgi:hypothetical protein